MHGSQFTARSTRARARSISNACAARRDARRDDSWLPNASATMRGLLLAVAATAARAEWAAKGSMKFLWATPLME